MWNIQSLTTKYMFFIKLKKFLLFIPSFLVFVMNGCWMLFKCFFCIKWYGHVIFLLWIIDMIDGYFDFQILVYHSQDKPLLRSTFLYTIGFDLIIYWGSLFLCSQGILVYSFLFLFFGNVCICFDISNFVFIKRVGVVSFYFLEEIV